MLVNDVPSSSLAPPRPVPDAVAPVPLAEDGGADAGSLEPVLPVDPPSEEAPDPGVAGVAHAAARPPGQARSRPPEPTAASSPRSS